MSIFLIVVAVCAWLVGFVEFAGATTVQQQTVAALIGVGGCVLFGSGAIVSAIDAMKAKLAKEPAPPPEV